MQTVRVGGKVYCVRIFIERSVIKKTSGDLLAVRVGTYINRLDATVVCSCLARGRSVDNIPIQ